MSRQHKPSGAGDYRRGYASGVRAAVDALLGDLETLGRLGPGDYDETGQSRECIGCLLTRQEFHQLSARWSFVMGVTC